MGELGLNKIFGALLAIALVVLGLREVTSIVFGGAEHGEHHYESPNDWAEASFHGYRMELADTGHGGEVVEIVYDLGLLLAGADASRGERSFKAKCASCHTITEGGSNGTGPNLFARIGAAKQGISGFGYSGALGNTEGDWTYANMDDWLKSPSKYARGTSMGFAGLSRDDERANVLAYLASFSPDAPDFPEPLPAVEDIVEGEAHDDLEETAADAETDGETIVEAVIEDATDTVAEATDAAAEIVTDVVDDAVEDATEAGSDVIIEIVETVEDTVEDVTETGDEH